MFRMIVVKSFLLFLHTIQFLAWNVQAATGRDGTNGTGGLTYVPVHIGVVLNLNSTIGTMAEVCISMALQDFYSVHSDYQTRLVLHNKDAREELEVVSQVLELLKDEDVHGILGPQTLTEDTFAAELGRKAQVPLISFTSRSQSLLHAKNPYFIRTTTDNSNQLKALAEIFKRYEWPEVVILYEETDHGNKFTHELYRKFLMEDIRLTNTISISASATDHQIKKELENLMTIQTRVFIVHMNAVLGGRLFVLAKRVGMMSKGYVWLVTDSLGNFLNHIDPTAFDSMEGVLGIRPHVPKSEKLESFRERWKKNMILSKSANTKVELNVYGLWAYDTVWALAMAVEKIRVVNTSFLKLNKGENGSDISSLRLSKFGPKLLNELHNTSFSGLSGKFQLIDGKLKSSALEIFNIVETGGSITGGGRPVGYWRPDGRITEELVSADDSRQGLKNTLWPGDSYEKPVGRRSLTVMPKLKVIVPKKIGFTEFVNVTIDPLTKKIHPTGFCIDFFFSILKLLPLKFDLEFHSFDPKQTTYTDLISSLPNKDFSIMVGDTTVLADRARSADFPLPFMDSKVVCVVKNKEEKSIWSFLTPFEWDLWVTIFASYPLTGAVLWKLEHGANHNSDSVQPHKLLGMFLWLPIAVFVYPEKYVVANSWSRFVLVVCIMLSYILSQGYSANYPSKSTDDKLPCKFSRDNYIGYQEGSFVRELLINRWKIRESRLRQYASVEEYDAAMTKGGKNGGIDVIVDEIPYMKLLLNQYGCKYKMLEQIYKTDGFSFAFPKDSELVSHFSTAILTVKDGPNMTNIEETNFGNGYASWNQLACTQKKSKLTVIDFAVLFIITGLAMIIAVFFNTSVGQKLIVMAKDFSHKCSSFMAFGGNDSRTIPGEATSENGVQQLSLQQITDSSAVDNQLVQNNVDVAVEVLEEGNEPDQINDNGEIQ